MRRYVGRIDRPIQVVLVEGNTHAQRVIAGELQKDPRIDLRAIASSLQDVKRILAQQEFDVMLLDLQLQSGQCLDVIDQVKQCMPLVEVVATSIDDDEALAMLAFEKGATGYLVKSSWFVSYGDAILEVVHGGAPVTASITRRLLPRLRNGAGARGARLDGRASQGEECLTLREQEVLQMVAKGHTSAEVATELGISVQTANAHLKNIYRKLQVRSRAQAVSKAIALGLLLQARGATGA
ncbi:response regulator transcription factor [Brachymonas denitrificans]|uniref:response regulator transcription factor n=2 Tax=Brachymonas denitrificans TaxID=28220 RepID=UPI001BCF6CB3|nr:response regulator transcription factor [Brachymonas denitrificans]